MDMQLVFISISRVEASYKAFCLIWQGVFSCEIRSRRYRLQYGQLKPYRLRRVDHGILSLEVLWY
jgi:hypothetical protein